MATVEKNLSDYDKNQLPDASAMRIGIVVSEWNHEITSSLAKGAEDVIREAGIRDENLIVVDVPGTFELPSAAAFLLEHKGLDGVVTIGSVIRGETAHFDFVCQAASQGVKDVALKFNRPVIFGVLTDDNKQQAIDRSGGKHGNKGTEAGVACLKMVALQKSLRSSWGPGFDY
ncbi:6,7-dimethyl-8-ribityllumazine synthase [Sanyastnella coralliicola]|uniref:6,7-dimethyl-8-ribityllumazine synthase n=1 Tax=Sanyastnella coralliicola TaxID=3069118 RepID=UPI0027B9DCC9|nr:6,7-dimethyl-8-ribityllumazine synthase [Longitalea sp. SCSIO 12813]